MPKNNMNISELLDLTIKNKASDLHLLAGIPPAIRVDGNLLPLSNYKALTKEDVEEMAFSLLKPEQKEMLLNNKEFDFSFGFSSDWVRYKAPTPWNRGGDGSRSLSLPSIWDQNARLGSASYPGKWDVCA